jgi:hypothetical protein
MHIHKERPTSPVYSLLRCSPAFVILAIVIACSDNFADPDLWIHIVAGQRMLHTGHILVRDLYSYAAPDLVWHNHEWLTEVILAVAYQWLGVIGLKLVKISCGTVIILGVQRILSRTSAPPPVQRLILLLTATGMMWQIQFRPTVFTLALLSIVLAKLSTEVYSGPVRMWPLVPLFALWANLHGGCFAGLGAFGVFIAATAVQELVIRHKVVRTWKLAAVAGGCALATLLNPLGIGLWTTFTRSATDPLMRPVINDWVPLLKFITYASHESLLQPILCVVPLLLFAALPAALFLAPAVDDAPLVAVAFMFTAGAFYSNRNLALAVLAIAGPLAHHIGLAVRQRTRTTGEWAGQPAAAAIAATAIVLALIGGEFSNRLKSWEPVPAGAVVFMKAHGLHGNILNDLNWGEYLIWHVTPESKVFIDARYQLVYPVKLRRDYLAFLQGWPQGEKLLERYPHRFALLKPGTGAYRIIAANPHWKIIYSDPVSTLFANCSDPAAHDSPLMVAGAAKRSLFP